MACKYEPNLVVAFNCTVQLLDNNVMHASLALETRSNAWKKVKIKVFSDEPWKQGSNAKVNLRRNYRLSKRFIILVYYV